MTAKNLAWIGSILAWGVVVTGCGEIPKPPALHREVGAFQSEVRRVNRSAYDGIPVRHPDELAGVWEAPDGRGGMVGIDLVLWTTIGADRTEVAGSPQAWKSLTVMMYQRTGPRPDDTERNSFGDGYRDGLVSYAGERLRVHWTGVDLDLQRTPGQTWTGRFHRGAFDQAVVLRRPRQRSAAPGEWFLGTWLERFTNTETCVHVGREADGNIVGWADSLAELGSVRFANDQKRPLVTSENYGALAEVRVHGDDRVSVELNVLSGSCCAIGFDATRHAENTMRTEWHGTARPPALWKRMPGESCLDRPR